MDSKQKKILIVAISLIALFNIIGSIGSGSESETEASEPPAAAVQAQQPKEARVPTQMEIESNKLVIQFKDAGLILDTGSREIFVNPMLWNQIQYQDKQNTIHALSVWCNFYCSDRTQWVQIKDAYSGKELARMKAGGPKIHEK